MDRKRFFPLAALGVWMASAFAHAAVSTTPSTELAFPLENQGASARAIAMGSAFVGVGGDASALFWNPAGLSTLREARLALHHNFYLQDLMQDTLVFASPLGSLGVGGLSASYVNYGALQGRDANGASTGNISAGRWGGELAWAFSPFPNFHAGLGLKGNLMNLPGVGYSNIAGDVGVLWRLDPSFHLGAAYANWGTNVGVYPVNSVARFGGAYAWSPTPDQEALVAAAVSWEPLGTARLHIGAEDVIGSFLALRAGYVLDLASQQLEGLTGLTAGLGFQAKDLALDYAYSPFGDLGASQRVSLSFKFGAPPSADSAAPASSKGGTVTVFAKPATHAAPAPDAPKQEVEKLRLFFSLPEDQEASTSGKDPGWEKKVQGFKDAIGKDPRDSAAWFELGMLYYQKAQKEDALQCFEQVLRLRPGNQKLRDWLKKYKAQPPG